MMTARDSHQRAASRTTVGRATRALQSAFSLLVLCLVVAPVSTAVAADVKVEPATLRIDWLARTWHAPFFLGIDKGWYREAGIELTVNEGMGSGNVVQLVGSKSDTFGFAGAEAVVRGVQRGIPVISVATLMPRNADAIFVLRKSGITRAQDLKGKTIATTPGGTSDALLPAFLKGAGLRVEDVTLVAADGPLKIQLVLQGKADAMNGPLWVGGSLDDPGALNVFPYPDYGVQVVGFGIVVHTDMATRDPERVRRFVAVTLRAWEYAVKHPEEALAALAKLAPENARPQAMARNRVDAAIAFDLVRPAVPGKPFGSQSEVAWDQMQKQLVEYGVVKETRPVAQYLTNRFVE
jgi:NitT/TauT family transport system substrate-binding protein